MQKIIALAHLFFKIDRESNMTPPCKIECVNSPCKIALNGKNLRRPAPILTFNYLEGYEEKHFSHVSQGGLT